MSFLRAEGEDPQAFVLNALAKHRLVIMGEVHNRPQYWAFNTSLVQAASFPRNVGVIYLELPSADQAMVDEFLSSSRLDPQPVIKMMRDMTWLGWPDQPTLDFFISVWKVNQSLAPEQRLRIVLVDPRAVWRDVHQREDAFAGEVYRDRKMADIILQDLQAHRHDPRHGLFIVGAMHARLGWNVYTGHSLGNVRFAFAQEARTAGCVRHSSSTGRCASAIQSGRSGRRSGYSTPLSQHWIAGPSLFRSLTALSASFPWMILWTAGPRPPIATVTLLALTCTWARWRTRPSPH